MAERREDFRAGDVDREFVAGRLKAALDEGRLSLLEYDERLQQAYAAKTYGDLDKVIADLPRPASAEASQLVPASSAVPATAPTAARARVPGTTRPIPTWLAAIWGAWLAAVSINVVIWVLVSLSAGEVVYFWPMWVAGPWGAVLVGVTVTGLLRGEPHRYADHLAEKEARRAAKRERRDG